MNPEIAVLLMAYGGPASLDEVEPFVRDVRGGRALPPPVLEAIRERYRKIGGQSPLLELTQAQARALERELTAQGIPNRTFVGMRHWHPYIREAVGEIRSAGLSRVIALCMAPQYSVMSVGAYFKQYRAVVEEFDLGWNTIYVKSWHQHPRLLEAFASQAREALSRFDESIRSEISIIFTAHSLPEEILEQNDPYHDQMKETASGVARLLDHPRWIFAYQSQGYGQKKWLGPPVEEVLRDLSSQGAKNVLVVPIGFVSDHVEVLYDVDIAFRELAASLGMRLERSRSLNDDPVFIHAMAAIVGTHLQQQE